MRLRKNRIAICSRIPGRYYTIANCQTPMPFLVLNNSTLQHREPLCGKRRTVRVEETDIQRDVDLGYLSRRLT